MFLKNLNGFLKPKNRPKLVHVHKLLFLTITLFILFLLSPIVLIPGDKLIYAETADITTQSEVAIVFGAGLKNNGRPSDVLSDRLITAAELYFADKVEKILVSGDNPTETYDEPTAMYDFLVTWGVPAQDISMDFAGRRTYDTCGRASNIWEIETAILVTQAFHLPRALFLCNHFGIDSKGISATRQPYINEDRYKSREKLATYKAILDIYLLRPKYIGGEVEEF